MAKGVMVLMLGIFLLTIASAAPCDLNVTLINQDPYPAVPGDYVKVVFQIDGVENPECGDVTFELVPQYPISLDPSQSTTVTIKSGTFTRDHSSFLMAPYKVRVDPEALDGDNVIEVRYTDVNTQDFQSKQFNLNVENVKADFEIYVKDYDATTNTLTFEILNIAKDNVEALAINIPKQDSITVKGANTNIVGDLDSNEYSTADFEAIPKEGQIKLILSYTDQINERRTLEKSVYFDPSYFQNRAGETKSTPWFTYSIILLIIVFVVWWFFFRKKKHSEHHELHHKH